MSDWKAGDVAMVLCSDERWRMATLGENLFGPVWKFPDGTYRRMNESQARPVAVIDPESAEDVDRLWGALHHGADLTVVDLADALREFAAPTPPRPDEPQGLGAVVEDANGDLFVKWSTLHRCERNWKRHDEQGGDYREWKRMVHPVRVLSEGVTP